MKFYVSIFFLCLYSSLGYSQEESWKLELDKQGIKVYTSKRSDTKILGVKAETVIGQASFDAFKNVLFDVEHLDEWVGESKSSEVLKEVSSEEKIYRMVLKVPFPFKDRDMVQHISVADESKDYLKVLLVNQPDYVPEFAKAVRMPVADGYWEFKRLQADDFQVTMQFDSDPGGEIPAWLINMFIVQSPYNTLLNLRDKVQE